MKIYSLRHHNLYLILSKKRLSRTPEARSAEHSWRQIMNEEEGAKENSRRGSQSGNFLSWAFVGSTRCDGGESDDYLHNSNKQQCFLLLHNTNTARDGDLETGCSEKVFPDQCATTGVQRRVGPPLTGKAISSFPPALAATTSHPSLPG